ncbi:glycosyltransferase [Pseudarthrobacter sp. J1763]|uniref:glycosyltransferase n=1 Tax=Pseudarthrobacter sp. J1763 TaxID=3420445 RepID=UPI003D2B8FBF
MSASVAVAAVTFDRPHELSILLDAINKQSAPVATICLVDSGTTASRAVAEAHSNVSYQRSEANLGGAGGFAFAILKALATGSEWIWLMDDDAEPADPDCLATLLREATARDLQAVVPLVISPEDETKLSFFFRLDGKVTHERAEVEKRGFLENEGHFFNGALIRADVFSIVGLPDIRLFIRGDEVDFTLRLRQAGIRFGTVTSASIKHPHAQNETQHVFGARWHVIVPDSAFKRYFYYRNRGYLIRRYFRVKSLVADLGGYGGYFLKRGDYKGLAQWFRAFSLGLRGRGFGRLEDQEF